MKAADACAAMCFCVSRRRLCPCHRIICGLTQFTNKSHVAFAALEAVCFQTREVSAAEFPFVAARGGY